METVKSSTSKQRRRRQSHGSRNLTRSSSLRAMDRVERNRRRRARAKQVGVVMFGAVIAWLVLGA